MTDHIRTDLGNSPPLVSSKEGVDTGPERSPHPQPLSPTGRAEQQDSQSDPSAGKDDEAGAPLPRQLGRYEVLALLGEGGFGTVYKAYDPELRRDVAVKVPRRHLIARPEDVEAYLAEGQVLAQLHHPHIVPVHDCGRTADGLCFVVSRFIPGSDLAKRINEARPGFTEAAQLAAVVAEALHYAHGKGLVHRDIKPGNILLDATGQPFVADFGLALREEDVGRGRGICGTPAYMSPEQANGEGHRVDGRSDIFSLGVVFYELLTGRRPFRGNSTADLLDQIVTQEARPPRQIDDTIPRELERICLKALSKRVADRYTTAKDMAEDLRHWLGEPCAPAVSAGEPAPARVTQPGHTPPAPTPDRPLMIVPKGLRSFDAADADFFLELLPGPRDRDGMPDSIRFWKKRIEETDADQTFSVGLIYGPSGCGKSSLVKAGLLPRLAGHVIAVYVEASGNETESRLLGAVRKKCPGLPVNLGLQDTLAALRRGQGVAAGQKVLLVLDQFEQWLHAHREEQHTELVQALRQCQGGKVQCLVLVRDDFWLAISRFLRELEVRLLEGHNSALVDLFDLDHARKVLAAFGVAFGKLPAHAEVNPEQSAFLSQALAGLAQEGKIISVRLALFAEMMKGKAWTPATLKAVGGAHGVGVTFLEETFSAATAPPEHRYHQQAARAVLKALLPESGTDIKGHLRGHAELLQASGYAGRPGDFEELLRILDQEIRLITPTDPEGQASEDSRTALPSRPLQPDGSGEPSYPPRSPGRFYQLTHDYLVPSLRDWLTRKQKETRRGRAELLLADRSAVWAARPENRQLPSLPQCLNIRLLTRTKDWTAPQRKMMRRAMRVHALRGAALAALLAVTTLLGLGIHARVVERNQAIHAAGLVHGLVNAEIAQVPAIVAELEDNQAHAEPLLQEEHERAAAGSPAQLHTSMALLRSDPGQLEFLGERLLAADADRFPVLRDFLQPYQDALRPRLWGVLEDRKSQPDIRFNAACALATYAPHDERWAKIQGEVANHLVGKNALAAKQWMAALRPVSGRLLAPLAVIFRDRKRRETERSLATDILADYAAGQPQLLADLLMDGDSSQFAVMYAKLKGRGADGLPFLRAEVDRQLQPIWNDAVNPAWPVAAPEWIGKINAADGLVDKAFAFCQTMALDEFLAVSEGLRAARYRPLCFRPYPAGQGVRVAAVWTRDEQDWKLGHGLSADEVRKQDAAHQKLGFQPVDVAGYLDGNNERHAILWVQASTEPRPSGRGAAHLEVGLSAEQLSTKQAALEKDGYRLAVYSLLAGADGKTRYSAIWTKLPGQTPDSNLFVGIEAHYSGENHLGELQVDVQVSKAGAIRGTKERFTEQLQAADKKLKEKKDDVNARIQRAVALYHLGQFDKAVPELSELVKKDPTEEKFYMHRALALARLGKAKEARADVAKVQELSNDPGQKAYVEAAVSAFLGEDEEGLKRLDAAVLLHGKKAEFLNYATRAFSLASQAVADKKPADAKRYAERAVELLRQAVAAGYVGYDQMQTDSDFDPVRQLPAFQELLKGGRLERRYAAIWRTSTDFTSTEVHGMEPVEHLAKCQALMAQGYRPAALSVLAGGPTPPRPGGGERGRGEGLPAASVWQRPTIPEDDKEKLAKRQANAAVALLRLGQGDKVWPLLKHSSDCRARSYLIHRLNPLGADAESILQRLDEEPDVSVRRALVLCLGEFDDKQLPAAQRDMLVPKLLALYRSEADPGLRGSAAWLLRHWHQQAKLQEIDQQLAKDKEARLERLGQQLRPNQGSARPGWYVNGQEQTYVVIPGQVEFLMGSPATEAGRSPGETLHRRRIGRSFAIAATAVTVAQFHRFRPEFTHNEMRRCPTEDSPIIGITWHEAAAYCNWLSEQEGLKPEEWCYVKNKDGQYAEGMELAADYLKRTGYRLPTEAEWEHACRAGALTGRYYGQTEELLEKYACFYGNSPERTRPVGSFKPNDLGLADMHGNVWTWCQETYKPYTSTKGTKIVEDNEDIKYINERQGRVLRGGAFSNHAVDVRSALRVWNAPATRSSNVGFRPARTFTP